MDICDIIFLMGLFVIFIFIIQGMSQNQWEYPTFDYYTSQPVDKMQMEDKVQENTVIGKIFTPKAGSGQSKPYATLYNQEPFLKYS